MKKGNLFLAALVFLWSCGKEAGREGEAGIIIPVTVYEAGQRELCARVSSMCAIRSRKKVMVAALVPGKIVRLYVREGNPVVKGETRLFDIDPKVAKENLSALLVEREVAEKGLADAEALLSSAGAGEEKARKDLERLKRLYKDEKSVTKDMVEKAEVAWTNASSGLKRAAAGLEIARKRVKQVGHKIEIAKKTLSDCTVYAPITGKVALKLKEEGEYASPGRPVLVLEDYGNLEAAAFFEQELFSRVKEGKTTANLLRNGRKIYSAPISFKGPRRLDKIRVFDVRLYLPKEFEGVNPGELLELELVLSKKKALAVPCSSVFEKDGRNFLFVVEKGLAREREVEVGIEDQGYIEVKKGITENDRVVVLGKDFLSEGMKVKVTGRDG